MRRILRELRRAPARIITTIVALALAVGAIGVFAIPTVASSSLRDAAEHDGLPHVILRTEDTGSLAAVDLLESVDGVERVEPQMEAVVAVAGQDGETLSLVGYDLDDQQMDLLRVSEGRAPAEAGEIVVTEGMAPVGTQLTVAPTRGPPVRLLVVGVGTTSYWVSEDVAFAGIETVSALAGAEGVNRLVLRATETDADSLRRIADEARSALGSEGVAVTELPVTVPNGTHPIEQDIQQVSSLIGLLGVVAGFVALVLVGSTTNTLITERTREVAVMRALGSRRRPLLRRLRRLAVGIAAAAVVIGVPLGVLISNFIARMVLEEFVGLTPGFAISVPVMVGSALFALIGARLVAARAARRVTKVPLASALRDREGSPYGRRFSERFVARLPFGGLLDRVAMRNGVHRRARSLATLAQITAAVAALMIITSLATTVNDFNAAELEPWNWESTTWVAGPGLDIEADIADQTPGAETTIETLGEVENWDIDVLGFSPETEMIDRTVDEGVWISGGDDMVVTTGFAERTGIAVGDTVEVELATGTHSYEVVGLHPYRSRAVFIASDVLAADLGSPGMANRLMSVDAQPPIDLGPLASTTRLDVVSEDQSARDSIVMIFGAIGLVVVSVAGLAVASGLAVNIFERRHEYAALRALGGRRRHVFRVVTTELLPLAAGGIALGLLAGYAGAAAIMGSFEASNAVEIGFTFATGAIPGMVAVVIVGSLALGGLMVRRVTRRPVAVTLRGAS